MVERRGSGDRIDVLMSVQYAWEETGGVSRWAIEAKPYIEDKTGGKVVLTFPKKKDDDESRLPEGYHFLGKVLTVPFQHHDTHYESSGRVNPKEVRKILGLENIIPHIAHIQEPLIGVGTNGIINGLPRTDDGEIISGLVGHVHVARDHLTRKTKFGIHVVKALGYHPAIMKKFDRTLAVSQATVDTWSQFWPVDYEIIPNGINTDELTPDGPIIEEWKKDPKKKTILYVGRHDRRKGVDDLEVGYNLLRHSERDDIQLKIGGNGYMTEELKRIALQLNIPDVEFLGILPREKLIEAYRTADVFVGPSTDGEAFNRTNAEALSCGTMVVTTDISGHKSAFGDAKGVVFVKPKDPEDLARGITDVLDLSKVDRRRLGRQGREYIVNNYFWPIVIDKLVRNVYQEILASKKDKLPSSATIYRKSK